MNTSENKVLSADKGNFFRSKLFRDLLLFAATFFWFGFLCRFGVDPHHDGIMLGAASLVAQGKLIFKEVFCQYGALAVLIQSIPVKLFGAETLVIKLTTVVFYGLCAILSIRIWERFLRPPFHWLWYGCFFMLCPFYLVPFHPWSSVYALFFMLLGVEGQLRYLEKGKTAWLWLSGVSAVGAFLCRTPCGVVAFAAGTALLAAEAFTQEGKERSKGVLAYGGGVAVAAAFFCLYLSLAGAWEDYFRQCYGFVWNFVVKRGGSFSWTQFSDSMIPLTGAFGFGNCIFALLPFLAIGFFLAALRPFFYRNKEALKENLPLLAILLLALGSWHQYFPVPCVRHLYWAAIPAFGVFALAAQKIWDMPRARKQRLALLALLAIPLLYCFYYRMAVLYQYFEKLPKRVSSQAPGIRGQLIFRTEDGVFNALARSFAALPPEIRARGVLHHTQDGLYSAMLPPPPGFNHPMFVNWGNNVYPDYDEKIKAFIREKRCSVFTTEFTELPGYMTVFGFTHFDTGYRLLVPVE